MFKIDSAGSVNGKFVDEDINAGIQPTVVSADWLNAVQSEIVGVLDAAGVTPSKASATQLATSVKALIEARVGDYVASTNVANVYTVSLDPVVNSYTAKTAFSFKASAANTGAVTLNAGGGESPLVRDDGADLLVGDIASGSIVSVVWDVATSKFRVTGIVNSEVALKIQKNSCCVASAGNEANAILATFSPDITSLNHGMKLYVRSYFANSTSTPTFTPNSSMIPFKTIIKGAGAALAAGDIIGSGHWLELQYDSIFDKWVLLNPATGVSVASQQTGEVCFFARDTAPTGFLKANGAVVSRTTYAALFAAIGTTFGSGDGSTTFALPDLRDRMIIGGQNSYALGAVGGSKDAIVVAHTHTATVTDPGHSHTYKTYGLGNNGLQGNANTNSDWGYASSSNSGTNISVSNSTSGTSGTNANLPPYISLLACIKY